MKGNLFKKLLSVGLVVTWGLIVVQSVAVAQEPFPKRPVNFWVLFPPGGGADTCARVISDTAEKRLGQKIVVINKPGGGGTVGIALLVKERPDGYTVGIASDSPVSKAPHMMDLSYDPFRDLSFIVRVAFARTCVAVRADSPFKKWEDVVEWAKKNPGELVYGHLGKGTSQHLGMVRISKKEGFTYKDVPFAGDVPLISALLGGHVMVAGGGSIPFRPHVDAKTLRALLTFEREGLDFAPDVTTFEKMHYEELPPPCYVIYGPKGIPDPVGKILQKAFIAGIQAEKFKEVAKTYDFLLGEPLTGDALRESLRRSYLSFEQLIKEAGLYKSEKK